MSMSESNPEQALREALAAFETSITTPVISGELFDWIEKVERSWTEVSQQIDEQLKELHPKQFDEIAEADAALLRQVELMRAEDECIADEQASLNQTVARMREHLPKFEPDEAKAQPHIEKIQAVGVAFVARVRKQEVAVQTWFAEAFNRERGGGD
jgi:uncharacterized protein (UPF0335 family)